MGYDSKFKKLKIEEKFSLDYFCKSEETHIVF